MGVIAPIAIHLGSQLELVGWLWAVPKAPLSKTLWAVALFAMLATSLLVVDRVSGRWLRSGEDRAARVHWSRGIGLAIVVLGVGWLSYRWHYVELPGDWFTWTKLAGDPFIMGSEPLGRWSHYLAHRLIALTGLDPWLGGGKAAVRLASVAAGSFYAAALLLLARTAFPRSVTWTSCLFLWVTPVAILFAGYMEVTPWRYAFTGTYLLTGLRYLTLDLKRPPWIESLVLMFAIWAHGSACFVAGGHAFLCLRWFFGSRPDDEGLFQPVRLGQMALVCLLPFVALAATLGVAYVFGTGLRRSPWYGNALGGPDEIFSIAWSEARQVKPAQYVFGSARYLIDQLNLALFACPLLLLLPSALVWSRRDRPAQALFLLLGFVGLLLFSLVFNPADRGGVRTDFDLMAGYAVPATLIVWLGWNAKFGNRQREALALAVAAATFVFLLVPVLCFP